jgi:hypothetical protein
MRLWESIGMSKKTVVMGYSIKHHKIKAENLKRMSKTIKIRKSPRRNSCIDPFKAGLCFIHKVKDSEKYSTKTSKNDLNEKFCQTDSPKLKSQTRATIWKEREFDENIRLMTQENFEFQLGVLDKAVSAGEPQVVKMKKVLPRNKYFRKSRNLSAWENDIDLEFL